MYMATILIASDTQQLASVIGDSCALRHNSTLTKCDSEHCYTSSNLARIFKSNDSKNVRFYRYEFKFLFSTRT